MGTKAHSFSGGYWIKLSVGWKWCTGAIFPRPGGDAIGKCVELPACHEARTEWQEAVIEKLRSFEPMDHEEVDLPTIELAIRHLNVMWDDAETDQKER